VSPARERALLRYLVHLRDHMRLQAWDLAISKSAPETDGAILTIEVQPARHSGLVRVGTFFDETLDEQRQTAVHELLHLVQAPMWDHFDLDAHDGRPTWSLPLAPDLSQRIMEFIHTDLERQADFLARMVAPTLPMPPKWPK
jgi:hypothetical protein